MLKAVFPTTNTRVTAPDGLGVNLVTGRHWWADDPVVKANAWAFSDDPRWGMQSTVALPEEPDDDAPAPAVAGRKASAR